MKPRSIENDRAESSKLRSSGKSTLVDWFGPLELAFWTMFFFVTLSLATLPAVVLSLLGRAAYSGDPTLLWIAIAIGAVGTVLLFLARLPLYRQRRFLTFGPRGFDERHRRLYRWAYRFIGASVLLLVLLLIYVL